MRITEVEVEFQSKGNKVMVADNEHKLKVVCGA